MGVDGVVYNFIVGFLSGRVKKVVVDSVRSEDVRVVSGVPQGSMLCP